MKFWFSIGSLPQSLYGTPESDPYYSFTSYSNMETAIEKDARGKYIQKFFGEDYIPQMITLPTIVSM